MLDGWGFNSEGGGGHVYKLDHRSAGNISVQKAKQTILNRIESMINKVFFYLFPLAVCLCQ